MSTSRRASTSWGAGPSTVGRVAPRGKVSPPLHSAQGLGCVCAEGCGCAWRGPGCLHLLREPRRRSGRTTARLARSVGPARDTGLETGSSVRAGATAPRPWRRTHDGEQAGRRVDGGEDALHLRQGLPWPLPVHSDHLPDRRPCFPLHTTESGLRKTGRARAGSRGLGPRALGPYRDRLPPSHPPSPRALKSKDPVPRERSRAHSCPASVKRPRFFRLPTPFPDPDPRPHPPSLPPPSPARPLPVPPSPPPPLVPHPLRPPREPGCRQGRRPQLTPCSFERQKKHKKRKQGGALLDPRASSLALSLSRSLALALALSRPRRTKVRRWRTHTERSPRENRRGSGLLSLEIAGGRGPIGEERSPRESVCVKRFPMRTRSGARRGREEN